MHHSLTRLVLGLSINVSVALSSDTELLQGTRLDPLQSIDPGSAKHGAKELST